MRRSAERILTTHTGSLPRPARVVELLLAEEQGGDAGALDVAVREAIATVVKQQLAAGIDVVNDGEQGRTDYTVHVIDRLTGFEGKSTPPLGTGEPEFPELAAILSQFASPFQHRPACSGPVGGTASAREGAGPRGPGITCGRCADDVAQVLRQPTCRARNGLGQVEEVRQIGDQHSAGLYRPR